METSVLPVLGLHISLIYMELQDLLLQRYYKFLKHKMAILELQLTFLIQGLSFFKWYLGFIRFTVQFLLNAFTFLRFKMMIVMAFGNFIKSITNWISILFHRRLKVLFGHVFNSKVMKDQQSMKYSATNGSWTTK